MLFWRSGEKVTSFIGSDPEQGSGICNNNHTSMIYRENIFSTGFIRNPEL